MFWTHRAGFYFSPLYLCFWLFCCISTLSISRCFVAAICFFFHLCAIFPVFQPLYNAFFSLYFPMEGKFVFFSYHAEKKKKMAIPSSQSQFKFFFFLQFFKNAERQPWTREKLLHFLFPHGMKTKIRSNVSTFNVVWWQEFGKNFTVLVHQTTPQKWNRKTPWNQMKIFCLPSLKKFQPHENGNGNLNITIWWTIVQYMICIRFGMDLHDFHLIYKIWQEFIQFGQDVKICTWFPGFRFSHLDRFFQDSCMAFAVFSHPLSITIAT